MRKLDELSASKLLAIEEPELLFSRFADEAKQEYRALALIWHPDNCRNDEAAAVFAHIHSLYRNGLAKSHNGTWAEPEEKAEELVDGRKKFILENNGVKYFEYIRKRNFELGKMYIGNNAIAYELRLEYTDLFHNARKNIGRLTYKNEAMAVEMSKNLPQVIDAFRCKNSNVLVLRKTPDQLLLADVLSTYKNGIDPIEHVGWILNVLYNIACYLDWSEVSHNAISIETVFISPLRHSGMLLGGWWYSTKKRAKLLALPESTLNILSPDQIDEKIASPEIDLDCVKAVGRELLGDGSGARLRFDKRVPPRLADALLMPSRSSALAEYREWKYEVLEDCFGKPAFIPLNLSSNELYKEK